MISALLLLSLVGVAVWWWLLRKGLPAGQPAPAQYRPSDIFVASALAGYFLLTIFAGPGGTDKLTPDLIAGAAVFYGFLIMLILGSLSVRGLQPARIFGLFPVASPLRTLVIGLVAFIATYPLVALLEKVVSLLGFPVSEDDEMVKYLLGDLSTGNKVMAILLVLIMAPLAEEIVFRGYLYGVARQYCGRLGAMFAIGLLFAAVHQNIPAIPALWALAIGLTLAYELTGSLWAPILMHVLFNAVSIVVIFFFPEAMNW